MHHEGTKLTKSRVNDLSHDVLGPGLLESAYEGCLAHDCGFRMDLVVEGLLVVEPNAVERLLPLHEAQLLTYLKLSGLWLGLRMNVHAPRLKDGLRRLVLQDLRAFVVKGAAMRWMALALTLVGPGEEPEAWVFFSPASPEAAALIRSFGDVPVRPVLLVEDYASGVEPSPAFLATLAASGPLGAADVDGLALAARLGIRDLPAAAVRRGGRWHVATGTDVNGKELLRCSR